MKWFALIFLIGCAAPKKGPKDFAGGDDTDLLGSDVDMSGGGDLAGGCTTVTDWPGLHSSGGFNDSGPVTFVGSIDVVAATYNELAIEDWHTMSPETYPKNVTIDSTMKYASCDVCPTLFVCDSMGCKQTYYAQEGTVTVTQADTNVETGTMKATATNLKLVEWNFDSEMNGGNKPVANGKCFQIANATWDVTWHNPLDGGTPDLTGVDLKGGLPDMTQPVFDLKGIDLSGDMSLGCHPVVNEVQTAGSALSTGGTEFVEVYNPCSSSVDLTGWTLVYRSAKNTPVTDITLYTFNTTSLASHHYFVVGGTGFSPKDDAIQTGGAQGELGAAGGAVGLRNEVGALIDSVSYAVLSVSNSLTETKEAANPPGGQSIARKPNGADTNNNSVDFKVATTPTPGAAN